MNNKQLILCLALFSTSTLAIADAPIFSSSNQLTTYLNSLASDANIVVSDADIESVANAIKQGYPVSFGALEKVAASSEAHAETLAKILANVNDNFAKMALLNIKPSVASAVLKVIDPTVVFNIFSTEVKGDNKELTKGAKSVAPIAKLMPPEKLAKILAQLTKEQAGAILEAMGKDAAKKIAQAIEEGYAATASNAELKAAMSEAAKTTVTGWTVWQSQSESAPTVNKYQQLVDAILAAKAAGNISDQQSQDVIQQAVQQSNGNVVVPSPSAP